MIKFRSVINFIIVIFFINGCSEILEPISLKNNKKENLKSIQEEFSVNIVGLNFKNAKIANKDIYQRKLMLTGSGPKANVINEIDLLKTKIPTLKKNKNYLLGVGDKLSFIHLNEYKTKPIQWPTKLTNDEYLLGVGDELTFVQQLDSTDDVIITIDEEENLTQNKVNNTGTILTTGIVGSTGKILLLGVGSVNALNRSLADVQAEVRNILIRNGLTPNFQLEISKFQSQKIHIVINDYNTTEVKSKILYLNNLPVTLKEIVLEAGMTGSSKDYALIKLTRDSKTYTNTVGQLFDKNSPIINIKNKDQIEINIGYKRSFEIVTTVGTKGYILLGDLGSIKAINRSLSDVQDEVINILNEKGLLPSFQLELIEARSRKVYFLSEKIGSKIIPLSNKNIHLKELIVDSGSVENNSKKSDTGLVNKLSVIKLSRNKKVYQITHEKLFDINTPKIWLQDGDQIELNNYHYKNGQVFALAGAGNAKIITINPSNRETLADILFAPDGALSNIFAKRSEVYLLRGSKPSVAYHLDAQNVSRILVAAKTELRPNDIVFVADRPIISFSRTLAEILPLRLLLKDIEDGNIP